MVYSNAEKAEMILIYGECRQNAAEACRVYAERYPDREHPTCRTFQNIYRQLYATGMVVARRRVRNRPVTGEAGAVGVLAAVAVNPRMSTRDIARAGGLSQSSVMRILHRHCFHPYHVSLHQQLHGNDFHHRVQFCQWALTENALQFYLFTDEAGFTNHGAVNLRNMHYWAVDNPRWLRQVERQRPWTVNVWCGIIGDHLIGPHFIAGAQTAATYIAFLQNDLPTLLENVPLETRRRMWYQHDGAPAHSAINTRLTLDRMFDGRFIGRGGRIHWPARSPDLTPLDFFLWGTLKENVYRDVPTTPEDMKQRIVAACGDITPDVLRRVRHSLRHRLQLCAANDGHHFEHLLA